MSKSPARNRSKRKSPYVPIWVMPVVRELARELAALRQQEINVVVGAVLTQAVTAARAVETRVQAKIAALEAKGGELTK